MKYVEPLNSSSYPERNGSYVNANPATGVKGSTVPGEALEHPQREILNVIEAAGLTPNGADLTQLLQALIASWLVESAAVTRTGDYTFTLAGDRSADYPMGKLLRFNSSDTYKCRVLGSPVVSDGVTTVTVWFDVTTVIPASISKLERSMRTPEDTARGVELFTVNEYDNTMKEKLIKSHCYTAITYDTTGGTTS